MQYDSFCFLSFAAAVKSHYFCLPVALLVLLVIEDEETEIIYIYNRAFRSASAGGAYNVGVVHFGNHAIAVHCTSDLRSASLRAERTFSIIMIDWFMVGVAVCRYTFCYIALSFLELRFDTHM